MIHLIPHRNSCQMAEKKKEIGEKCLILTYMPVGTKLLILIVIF